MSSILNSSSGAVASLDLSSLLNQCATLQHKPLAALAEVNRILELAAIGTRLDISEDTEAVVCQDVHLEPGKKMRPMPHHELALLAKVVGKLHAVLVNEAICRKAQELYDSQTSAPTRWISGHAAGASSSPQAKE